MAPEPGSSYLCSVCLLQHRLTVSPRDPLAPSLIKPLSRSPLAATLSSLATRGEENLERRDWDGKEIEEKEEE